MNRNGRTIKLCAGMLAFMLSLSVSIVTFSACSPKKTAPLTMLKAQGTSIVNEEGETVYLRGVNAGGLGVIEQWMTGFSRSEMKPEDSESEIESVIDHKTTTKVFLERFGWQETETLWNIYQDNWWTDDDFKNCADMGMNVIRLPFTYMNVDFEAVADYSLAGYNYDFTFLDDFVARAAEYGLYTILDLHGAYGSQNGQDHSGEVKNAAAVDFYSNETMQTLTVNLWRAIAEHFAENPNVAGYDLLNEPAERNQTSGTQNTTTRHFLVFDKIYKAIREVDENHIVIFESCWDGKNLPHPSEYNWTNCMYSFHHYTNCTGDDNVESHKKKFDDKLKEVSERNFGVPLYMGEFTCYNNEEQWTYTLNLMNEQGWHWTSWTYKTSIESPWGIYNSYISSDEKVHVFTDSYDDIIRKFAQIKTVHSDDGKSHLTSGKTLYDVIKSVLKTEEQR